MKRNQVVLLMIFFVFIAIVVYTLQGGETEEEYSQRIIRDRKVTHDFMLTSEESPFGEDLKKDFQGLNYFPVDPKYRIRARFEPIKQRDVLSMPTSTGETENYVKKGYAKFDLDGQEHRLLILQSETEQSGEFFLPFADETSGDETYGGGRYINIEPTTTSVINIDFNKAYNPYCAYNETYSCPLPPQENVLPVPILAGEKIFENYH
ncbi:DUF1684 domain-containing protein [soil metagenome]